MALDRRNGVKLAGVVLSGTLVLGGAVPAAAGLTPENTQEAAEHQTEEKTEVIVFLNTAASSDEEEKGPFDEQAVASLEEAFALFGIQEEKGPAKFEMIREENRILVLCGESELTEEELALLEENEITLMAEEEYEAILKAQEEAEKEAEEQEVVAEPIIVLPGAEDATIETPPPFIWEAPQISIADPVQTPVAEDTVTEATPGMTEEGNTGAVEEVKPSESTGILLPGFSVPSGEVAEAEETETIDEEVPVEEVAEEITEEDASFEDVIVDEPVVYTLFALFADETFEETAEAVTEDVVPEEDIQPLALASEETADADVPMVLSLPGIDLVGNGTSGVGGGSKPAPTPAPTPAPAPAPAQRPTAPSAGGNSAGTTGNTSGNTNPAAPSGQTVKPSVQGLIQTGDASGRTLWGFTAGISGGLAAFFAAQWRRLRRD